MSIQYPEEFAKKSTIKADPFIKRILGRMSPENKKSFNEDQLIALKLALIGQKWNNHPLDIRGALGFWRWRYYYVLLAGKETRALNRRQERVTKKVYNFFILGVLVFFSTLFGFVILYLSMMTLGIDILSIDSPGIWDWLQG